MTLFEPHLSLTPPTRLSKIDASFVRAHSVLFSGRNDDFQSSVEDFISRLDDHIARATSRWMDSDYHIGIALGVSLLEYGDPFRRMAADISRRNSVGAHEAVAREAIHHPDPYRLLAMSDIVLNMRPPSHRKYFHPSLQHLFDRETRRTDPGDAPTEGRGVFCAQPQDNTPEIHRWIWGTFTCKWPTLPRRLTDALDRLEHTIRHEVEHHWRDCCELLNRLTFEGLVWHDISIPEMWITPSTTGKDEIQPQQREYPRRLGLSRTPSGIRPPTSFENLEHTSGGRCLLPLEGMICHHLP